MKTWFDRTLKGLEKTVKESSELLFLSFLITIISLLDDIPNPMTDSRRSDITDFIYLYYIPFIILSYVFIYLIKPKFQKGLYRAIAYLPVLLMLLLGSLRSVREYLLLEEMEAIVAYVTALVALILFSSQEREDREIVRTTFRVMTFLSIIVAFTLLANGLIFGVIWTIGGIFDVDVSFLSRVCITLISFVLPPLLYHFLSIHTEVNSEHKSLEQILFHYILSPALIAYFILLILYYGKLLIIGATPEGTVAYMIIALFLLGLLSYAGSFLVPGGVVTLAIRFFKWSSLPAVTLFGWAVWLRVHEYGLTAPRIYLILIGGIMSLVAVLLIKRSKRLLYILLVTTLIAFPILTYNIVLTPRSIAKKSQTERLYRLLKSENLLNEKGKVLSWEEIQKKNIDPKKIQEIYDLHLFLKRQAKDLTESEAIPTNQVEWDERVIYNDMVDVDGNLWEEHRDYIHFDPQKYETVIVPSFNYQDRYYAKDSLHIPINVQNQFEIRLPLSELRHYLEQRIHGDSLPPISIDKYEIYPSRIYCPKKKENQYKSSLDIVYIGILKEEVTNK